MKKIAVNPSISDKKKKNIWFYNFIKIIKIILFRALDCDHFFESASKNLKW